MGAVSQDLHIRIFNSDLYIRICMLGFTEGVGGGSWRGSWWNLRCNEVYHTNDLILLVKIMLCGKLLCIFQKSTPLFSGDLPRESRTGGGGALWRPGVPFQRCREGA